MDGLNEAMLAQSQVLITRARSLARFGIIMSVLGLSVYARAVYIYRHPATHAPLPPCEDAGGEGRHGGTK